MLVRAARARDAEQIRAIYNAAVATDFTFDLRPRTLADQESWLAARTGAYAAIVAVDGDDGGDEGDGVAGGDVVGFASLSPYRDRPAYSTTVEDSIYVREDQRGRGVGKQLLAELLVVAEVHGFHSVIARIVGHNDPSIALHRSMGFELVGTEREVGRKFRRWLDVVAMQKLFTTPGPPPDG